MPPRRTAQKTEPVPKTHAANNVAAAGSSTAGGASTTADHAPNGRQTQGGGAAAVDAPSREEPPPSEPGEGFRWSQVLSILIVFAVIASATLWSHYHLPTPRSIGTRSLDEPAHFSEQKALEYISVLSDEIGYRIVGTKEHVRAEKWIENVVKQYEGWHRTITPSEADNERDEAAAANETRWDARGDTQVEVWTQVGDGSHRFEMISQVIWKKYYSMSNVVVRISDGTDAGKEHALLVNAHLDSTLPSPGAADDGAGVAILLEALRVLTTPPRPRLRHAVILLFNNGEESLQDASHLYATQHNETRHSVRGVVNLEACGTSGPELLFQATSVPFIEAYATVPYPFGTVIANDVFSTGLILSDTDFRQFVEYGENQSGLDIAIIGNSYQYHTRQDVTENLQPGMMQHFGENTLAIIDHLCTSSLSKLAVNQPFRSGTTPIYFSIAGRFFLLIPAEKFKTVVMGVCALSNYFMTTIGRADKHFGALKYALLSLLFTVLSLVFSIASSNVVALLMVHVFDKPLSWYSREWLPVLLFAPPALVGLFSTQYVYASLTRRDRQAYLERANLDGLSLFFVLSLLGLNAMGVGSSYLAAVGAIAMMVCICVNDMYFVGFTHIESKLVAAHNRVHWLTYLFAVIVPASVGSEGLMSFLDLFVPLTGRTGEISPAEHMIASICGALTFLCLPFALPLSMRMGRKRLASVIIFFASLTALSIAIFASPTLKPFDATHQKRFFVHGVQNITSDSFWLNMGGVDPDVKGLEAIVQDVHTHMGIAQEPFLKPEMNEYNHDFAILYPISTFLTPYKLRIATPPTPSPWMLPGKSAQEFAPRVSNENIDWQAGTRSLTITLHRPDLIWSVMAFDADIISWDLPAPPPQGMQRHHIKEVARHGIDEWSIDLVIRLSPEAIEAGRAGVQPETSSPIRLDAAQPNGGVPRRDPSKLWIDYSAIVHEAMWPQAARLDAQRRARYPSIDVLQSLDEFLIGTHPEIDVMLLSVVAAVAQV